MLYNVKLAYVQMLAILMGKSINAFVDGAWTMIFVIFYWNICVTCKIQTSSYCSYLFVHLLQLTFFTIIIMRIIVLVVRNTSVKRNSASEPFCISLYKWLLIACISFYVVGEYISLLFSSEPVSKILTLAVRHIPWVRNGIIYCQHCRCIWHEK